MAQTKLTHRCGSSSGDGFALFDSAGLVQLLDERDRSRGKDGLGEASKASVDAAEVEQRETGEYTRMNNIRLDAAQGGRGRSVRGTAPPHAPHVQAGSKQRVVGQLDGDEEALQKVGVVPAGHLGCPSRLVAVSGVLPYTGECLCV